MKITEKTYEVSVKGSKNFQSVGVTESFTVLIDDKFDQLEFETTKVQLKERLIDEVKSYINQFDNEMKNNNIDLGGL